MTLCLYIQSFLCCLVTSQIERSQKCQPVSQPKRGRPVWPSAVRCGAVRCGAVSKREKEDKKKKKRSKDVARLACLPTPTLSLRCMAAKKMRSSGHFAHCVSSRLALTRLTHRCAKPCSAPLSCPKFSTVTCSTHQQHSSVCHRPACSSTLLHHVAEVSSHRPTAAHFGSSSGRSHTPPAHSIVLYSTVLYCHHTRLWGLHGVGGFACGVGET